VKKAVYTPCPKISGLPYFKLA